MPGRTRRRAALVVLIAATAVRAGAQPATPDWEWPTRGADLANTRYAPLDQIDAANFEDLELAWRFGTHNLGPRPDYRWQTTPLVADGVMYTTAGSRRAVVAIDAASGELLWVHRMDEGRRGELATRGGSGRGVAYWTDGGRQRIFYITPGYRLVALDARTGVRIPSFGVEGIVDLRLEMDQPLDLVTGDVSLRTPPVVAGNTIIVGASHAPGQVPRSRSAPKGHVRAYDVLTGERLWIFHTIPAAGEFGADTWLNDSRVYTGHTGVWAQITVDLELGLAYLPIETPTGDHYGGHRPGDNLFSDSLVAVDLETGERVWHYQFVHHDIWDYDLPCGPILADITVDGRTVKAVAQPTKQSWLYVFDRATGEPVWPIEERPVEAGDVPGEWYAPTQPFPTRPPAYDRQGVAIDDLIDFTPELRARAVEIASRYKLGPIFTPPVVSRAAGPLGTLTLPNIAGGSNWPGGSLDPETGIVYLATRTSMMSLALVEPNAATSDMSFVVGTAAPGRGTRSGRRHADSGHRAAGRRSAAGEAALWTDHGDRPAPRRHPLAGPARRDAGRCQEPPGARGSRHSPYRQQRRRHAGDADAAGCRRRLHLHGARRQPRRHAARLRQVIGSGGGDAATARGSDGVADDVFDRGRAVHRAGRRRRGPCGGAAGVQAAVLKVRPPAFSAGRFRPRRRRRATVPARCPPGQSWCRRRGRQ